jgi:hypothetical protein
MNAKDANLFRFIIASGVRNLLFGFLTLVIPMQQRSRSLTARLRASCSGFGMAGRVGDAVLLCGHFCCSQDSYW